MLVSRLASLVLMIVAFAALGRLLSPANFGHFALAMAIYVLARTISEFGLRQHLIRAPEIDKQTLARAAGLSLALSVASFIFCIGLGLGLRDILLPTPVADALLPLAFTVLIGPFLLATEVMLRRALDFRLIARVEVLRTLVDGTVAVILAILGFGALALALGVLVSHIAAAAAMLIFGGQNARIVPQARQWRPFGHFGMRLITLQLLPKGVNLALFTILGGALGPATLGLFNRAQTIHGLLDRTLFEGITPVILPTLSRLLHGGIPPKDIYISKIDYLVVICWPSFALIALLADSIVATLLGPQWTEAVPAVRILAIMGVAFPFTKMSQDFFVAIDELEAFLRLQFAQQTLRLALAGSAAFVSLEVFCAAFTATLVFKAIGVTLIVRHKLGDAAEGYRSVAVRGIVVTVASLAGPILVTTAFSTLPSHVTLILVLPLASLGWLLAIAASRHRLWDDFRVVLQPGSHLARNDPR